MKKGKDFIGVGVGAVILNEKNEILLMLRNRNAEVGYWSVPGGSVEFMETLEDAIIREVKEELDVTIEIIDLLVATNHIIYEESLHWVAPAFLAKIIDGELRNVEPEKHKEVRWFPLDNLPDNLAITAKSQLEGYRKWLAKNKLAINF